MFKTAILKTYIKTTLTTIPPDPPILFPHPLVTTLSSLLTQIANFIHVQVYLQMKLEGESPCGQRWMSFSLLANDKRTRAVGQTV